TKVAAVGSRRQDRRNVSAAPAPRREAPPARGALVRDRVHRAGGAQDLVDDHGSAAGIVTTARPALGGELLLQLAHSVVETHDVRGDLGVEAALLPGEVVVVLAQETQQTTLEPGDRCPEPPGRVRLPR